MEKTIDARGLSCPQPVLMTLEEIKTLGTGTLVIVVDTETAKENVSRAAASQGWGIKQVTSESDGYRITITK
ncbi:MAG TPA: sulfurtransferase TusA family protein [Thermodesulfobacteriota bacterium]|nr:sulfurtransferase TusA family protein [Thermodesulfobacteriota bacterium]HNU71148.1 sulfurtransferase TusA family protein [Thermodesulfobacteriota bacterium]HQO79213.1 sulfurtransferase TusA family protein [Thermodesulfobacteriota bacterium]